MAGYRGGFGGFGGGNQMQNLMKQAQKMQEDIQRAQQELEEAELIGEAAGGAVKVTVSGKKIVKGVTFDPSVIDPDDAEMLEDLFMAAYNSACEKADELSEEKLGAYSKMGGMF